MKNNRRNFLKLTGLAGIGVAGTVIVPACTASKSRKTNQENIRDQAIKTHIQRFNMSGYAAPKIDTVRIGIIGLGARGADTVALLPHIDGIDIRAVCDLVPQKADAAKKQLETLGFHPDTYSGKEDSWKQLCDRNDIDLVYIITPWALHTPMAVYAMEHGIHVGVEVPAGQTIDECWQLVETSERTKKHCMMLENCCYDFFELLTLNMARQGLFGEIVHAEGAYLHNLLEGNFSKEKYWNMWRLKENFRNANLYPTHGLGPVAQLMNINRGDKMDYLISMSSNDFMMEPMANELAAKDDFYKPFANKKYRGNMNITTIRTDKGRSIMLQHDESSPNIYSRIHKIIGTKGTALKYPLPGRLSFEGEDWISEEAYKKLEGQYQPPIVKKVGELAKQVGGHGGMDFLMDWRTIDCLRNGLPLDEDVYDAALWSSITPLSEWSVANRSNSVTVPDFTGGSWKVNKPVDITLEKGGTTKVMI